MSHLSLEWPASTPLVAELRKPIQKIFVDFCGFHDSSERGIARNALAAGPYRIKAL
jgi:hypothetical protein